MGRPVNSNVARAETTGLNTKVNKEVFEAFKDCLGEFGYPMNVMLETFMKQYANGRFKLSDQDIRKWAVCYNDDVDTLNTSLNDGVEVASLNTTFNKEIYINFKYACKMRGYFLKHVLTAFMEKFANGDFVLEYVERNKD